MGGRYIGHINCSSNVLASAQSTQSLSTTQTEHNTCMVYTVLYSCFSKQQILLVVACTICQSLQHADLS